jgi:hypothetical protein
MGRIKLSDGTVIKLKTLIVDMKESGFSPFGGVNFDVKIIGGTDTEACPTTLRSWLKTGPSPLQDLRERAGRSWI